MRVFPVQRQVILLFSALLIPCVALVVLGARMLRQDAELREKRRIDERRRVLRHTSTDLLARLETIRQRALASTEAEPGSRYPDPAVVLVGFISEGTLLLPWDPPAVSKQFRHLRAYPDFEPAVRQGEREEFALGQPEKAVNSYTSALRTARHPLQSAYARLLRARALDATGRRVEASADFGTLLSVPPAIADEEGVPFQLLAADRLSGAGSHTGAVLEAVASVMSQRAWLPPSAYYVASTVTQALAGGELPADARKRLADVKRRVDAGIRMTAQAVELQNDFARLVWPSLRDSSSHAVWVPYGDETWLLGRGAGTDGGDRLIAVRGSDVFLPVEQASGNIRFLAPWGAEGELLADGFPGLKVGVRLQDDVVAPAADALRAKFLYAAILLVLMAAVFGAFLLWRDLRREMALAEMRSQFVASVSHELKTPLTAIRMFAETLQLRPPGDPKTAGDYLETIVEESARLTRLVDTVLRFSRIERGTMRYHLKPVFLNDVVDAALRTMQHLASQQGFRILVEVDDDVPALPADKDALHEAVVNLLSNAIKYSGGTREIKLALSREAGAAVIRVTDYGCGIGSSEHARIFEKFYRVPSDRNASIPGTGLGLTIVAHAVKAHGGRVQVESAPDKGSTFAIYLPLEGPA